MNISAALAQRGRDVVLVDADRQCTSANWAMDRSEKDLPTVHCVQKYENIRDTLKDLNRLDEAELSYNKSLEIDENDSYILNHNWKGNVRELRNLIERIAILQPDTKDKISNIIKESLKNTNFDDQLAENSLSVPLKEAREKFEKEYLTIQLKKFNGNISKTASFVGMERSALHRKLKGLGIKEYN